MIARGQKSINYHVFVDNKNRMAKMKKGQSYISAKSEKTNLDKMM